MVRLHHHVRTHLRNGTVALAALAAVVWLALAAAPATPRAVASQMSWSRPDAPHALDKLGPFVPPIFGPNVRANTDTTSYGQHEPGLAVSRTDNDVVFAAAKDYRDGNIKRVWIYGSTDGGSTWPVQLHMPGLPPTVNESDPVVMARDDGRIYVSCLTTGNEGIFITWTDDNGTTWQPSVPIIQNQPVLQDKDWFAIDNNPASPFHHRMYMMYAPGANYVVEHHSTDGGLTWSPRQQIGGSNTEYTYPVVASDGTVYNFMMYNWGNGQIGTVQMTRSTDGGATWSTPSTVAMADQAGYHIRPSDQFRFFSIISAGVDPLSQGPNHTLYVSWTDDRAFNTTGTDVLYVKSTDGGATWGQPINLAQVSGRPECPGCDNITPMMTVGQDGKVHAFWLDRADDPAPPAGTGLFHSWYTSSTDGGATWDPATRVSTEPQNLNVGFPPGSGDAAGDYWGLDVSGDSVYVAWNDTRYNQQQDILVSRGIMGGPTATPTPTQSTPPPTNTTAPSATATTAQPTNTPTQTWAPTWT
ncbi:MAG TPA: sialidase family protein, partial [Chloroflexia bacterium]|nr:sialidase family protein [Chloroflexia bacterium]